MIKFKMKTVGEILKETRLKQKKSLEEISQKIKIPLKTLQAIEQNNFKILPPLPFVKGFIRNYAQELDLDPEKILAFFRRDNQLRDGLGLVPKGQKKNLTREFFWSPKLTTISLLSAAIILIIAFFVFQVKDYFFKPSLRIFFPKEDVVIQETVIEVKGKTIPDANLYINDELTPLEFDGSFNYQVKLLPGENIIKIKAVNRGGKETEVRRRIVVDKKT